MRPKSITNGNWDQLVRDNEIGSVLITLDDRNAIADASEYINTLEGMLSRIYNARCEYIRRPNDETFTDFMGITQQIEKLLK